MCASGLRWFCSLSVVGLLLGCSNGSGSVEEGAASPPSVGGAQQNFSIGGIVTGLTADGLVLQNNGSGDIQVSSNGAFSFMTRVADGAAYNVTVASHPASPPQTCSVTNGSGFVAGSNITSVEVRCSTGQFLVGGAVAGLTGTGLVLQNNAGDDLSISSNGSFTFATRLADGAPYSATVRSHPSGQSCVIRNASGTIDGNNVTDVQVSCASGRFTVAGTATGVAGTGLVLELNGGSALPVAGSGPFAFAVDLPDGAAYQVSVRTQPSNPTQNCTVANPSGTVRGANIANIAVSCTTTSFTVGGTITGLVGSGLTLDLNNGNELLIASNGSFTFASPLQSGTPYQVTVRSQPANPMQICTVARGTGTISSTNVTSVQVTCASTVQSIGGSVSGLLGSGLVLQNNGDDTIAIDADGPFRFATELATGTLYNVTVSSQPSDPQQACSISNGRGTVGTTDVTTIVVNCTTSEFTIGGVVEDLEGSGLVLRNNDTDELTIDESGAFTFGTALPSGATYNVTIAEQPRDPQQTCTVSNRSGVVASSNVTSVRVTCSTEGFAVGGHVSELRGSGLILQNNGTDDLSIASNGSFRFATPLPSGAGYNVTIARQPSNPSQRCEVRDGSGTIRNSDIQDVEVKCEERDDDDDDD